MQLTESILEETGKGGVRSGDHGYFWEPIIKYQPREGRNQVRISADNLRQIGAILFHSSHLTNK